MQPALQRVFRFFAVHAMDVLCMCYSWPLSLSTLWGLKRLLDLNNSTMLFLNSRRAPNPHL